MTTPTKAELQYRRQQLIDQIPTATTAEARMQLQADITAVKAEIKRLNTIEAAELKAAADRRKAAGLAEQAANMARSKKPLDHLPPLDRSLVILRYAEQLLGMVDVIDDPEPHIAELGNALTAFSAIERQRRARPAPTTTTDAEPTEWDATWKSP